MADGANRSPTRNTTVPRSLIASGAETVSPAGSGSAPGVEPPTQRVPTPSLPPDWPTETPRLLIARTDAVWPGTSGCNSTSV